jgi:hypothetical protein
VDLSRHKKLGTFSWVLVDGPLLNHNEPRTALREYGRVLLRLARTLLLSFFGPVTVLPAILLGVLAGAVAHAEGEALPPRTQWRASSSSVAQPTMPPAFAIDGNASTKWGGAFSPGHWLQVDLSRTAAIGGALIHWDSAFAAAYLGSVGIRIRATGGEGVAADHRVDGQNEITDRRSPGN